MYIYICSHRMVPEDPLHRRKHIYIYIYIYIYVYIYMYIYICSHRMVPEDPLHRRKHSSPPREHTTNNFPASPCDQNRASMFD